MGVSARREALSDQRGPIRYVSFIVSDRGQLLPLYAVLLPVVVLVVAILVDLGFILMHRLQLQQIAAGAAAAGAEYYDEGRYRASLDVTLDRGAAEAAARADLEANLRTVPGADFRVRTTEREVIVEAWRTFRPWWWPAGEFTVVAAEKAAPLGTR